MASLEFFLPLVQITIETFVEFLAPLDGKRIVNRLAREFTQDVSGDIQTEDRRQRS